MIFFSSKLKWEYIREPKPVEISSVTSQEQGDEPFETASKLDSQDDLLCVPYFSSRDVDINPFPVQTRKVLLYLTGALWKAFDSAPHAKNIPTQRMHGAALEHLYLLAIQAPDLIQSSGVQCQ